MAFILPKKFIIFNKILMIFSHKLAQIQKNCVHFQNSPYNADKYDAFIKNDTGGNGNTESFPLPACIIGFEKGFKCLKNFI